MKKFFTLIAMALVAIGVNAQTTIFDAAAAGWSGKTLTSGTTTVGDVTWHGGEKAEIKKNALKFSDEVSWTYYLKTGGSSTFSTASLVRVLSFTPTKNGTVKVYCAGGGDADRKLAVSQSVTATNRDEETIITSFDGKNKASGIATASVEANKEVYIWGSNSFLIYGITFEESGPTEAVDAVFSLTKNEINTFQTSQIIVNSKAGLDGLTMSDLTYDNAVITIDETGKITPVAAGTSTITFTTAAVDGKYKAGSANLSITVTTASLDEQVNVTASATWDWSKFGTPDIKFTEETTVNEVTTPATTPAKDEEFVLSNVVTYGWCDAIGSDFGNAKALKVKCEYPVRDGKYFQGGSIKFTTTVAGKLSVEYSNTGNRSAEADRRYLNVNGTNYGEGTMKSSENVTTSDIAVAAGEVVISGRKGTNTVDEQYLRIYKIVFTAGGTDGIQTLKSAQAANDAAIYNLAGQKVGNGFKGIAIQNGKKVVIK